MYCVSEITIGRPLVQRGRSGSGVATMFEDGRPRDLPRCDPRPLWPPGRPRPRALIRPVEDPGDLFLLGLGPDDDGDCLLAEDCGGLTGGKAGSSI